MTTKIFITGATGFVGGTVLPLLLKNKSYEVTALCREKTKATKLEALGAKTVIGDLDDTTVLEHAATASDVVLHLANSDHVGSATALTNALKKKGQATTGRKPIYIHVSGTGVIIDQSFGAFASDKVFDDAVHSDVHDNIPDTAWHRNVDLIVFAAGRTGFVDTYILCPPLIYAEGTGLFNRESTQVPNLIRSAIKHKRAVHVGKGLNIWSNVHVEDLADFFLILVDKALKGEAPKNDDGLYFTENGSSNFKVVTDKVGEVLKRKGIAADATSEDLDPSTASKVLSPPWVGAATGHNSRSRATKARKLGWNPRRPALMDTIEATVERISLETQ